MPRISAEARSAAAYRAGGERPEPPAGMTGPAKVIWREIVADRPIDFFRPGSLDILEDYCQLRVEGRRLIRVLARTRIGGTDYLDLQKQVSRNSANMLAHATKLRITVQADVDGRSKKTAERGDASADDGLIGGTAVRGKLKVVK